MVGTLAQLLRVGASTNETGGIIASDSTLYSWPTLDRMTDHLASALVAGGVEPGDRVAVLHPKSVWSFLAVHSILRAGAVMVPIDPMGPVDGIAAVLAACSPTAIIGHDLTIRARAQRHVRTHEPLVVASGDDLGSIEELTSRTIALDVALEADIVELPDVGMDDPAYIIFTSGSTGDPKGMLHTHRSAMAYVSNALITHDLTTSDRIAGTCPLHFDMSTLELYVVPAAGAAAVVVTEVELRFPVSLSARLEQTGCTVIYAVPYQLRQLCQRGEVEQRDLRAIRQVGFGGEQFAPGVLQEVMNAFPSAEFVNVYGPAETNGIVSHTWPAGSTDVDTVPIGRPWPGVEVRLVDEDLAAVPQGQQGELLVASPSQMDGYWQQPDLNGRSFVEADGRRWYRTGDVLRAGDEGVLYFLGRADTRVKVRGVRLELETIESVLSDAPGVDSAVVGVAQRPDGMQEVVTWVLLDGSTDTTTLDLRRWCAERLPDSAVPSDVRFVTSFSSNRTGKIDRQSLRSSLDTEADQHEVEPLT